MKNLSLDFFNLPFDVYYSDEIPVTSYQFMSDVNPKKFSDIRAVHYEQGYASGVTFRCEKNNGPELYCCIINSHDEVNPSWLMLEQEDEVNFNFGSNLLVNIEGKEIKFSEPSDEHEDEDSEDYVDFESMDYCLDSMMAYHLEDVSPDYLILDPDGERIKVNLEGFVLNDNDDPTDERIFNPEELDEEKYSEYDQQELWGAKWDWVNGVLTKNFIEDKHLKLSFNTK